MTKIYAVLLNTKGRIVPSDAIENVLNVAKNWLRFDPKIWIVATNLTSQQLYDRVHPVIDPKDDILIVAIDINDRQGWVVKTVIDWIEKDHDSRPGI